MRGSFFTTNGSAHTNARFASGTTGVHTTQKNDAFGPRLRRRLSRLRNVDVSREQR